MNRNYPILPTVSEVEDDDVAMERSKVLGGHCNNAVLRMESLTKVNCLENLLHLINNSIILVFEVWITINYKINSVHQIH